MRAAFRGRVAGRPALVAGHAPAPVPRAGEVQVRVLAAGVNRADLMILAGVLQREGSAVIMGYECAGTVLSTAPGERRWKAGDRVCGMTVSGAYAEIAVARSDQLLPAPPGLSPAEAAALPLAACTIWAHLFDFAGLSPGKSVLIHGGASGVGSFAIQLASAFGLSVFASAGSAAKVALCERLGAQRAVNYREEDFVEVIAEATGGRGVDAVLDVVGGPYLNRNVASLAVGGTLLVMGYQGGWEGQLDLRTLNAKLASIASVSFSRSTPERRAAIVAAVETQVWPLLATGTVRAVVGSVFPLERAAEAFAQMDNPDSSGKVVLSVGPAAQSVEGWTA